MNKEELINKFKEKGFDKRKYPGNLTKGIWLSYGEGKAFSMYAVELSIWDDEEEDFFETSYAVVCYGVSDIDRVIKEELKTEEYIIKSVRQIDNHKVLDGVGV